MTRTLLFIGLLVVSLASCKKDGATPAYIHVNTPVVLDDNGHIVSSKIPDLWVYVNDKPAGVWEPGDAIPLIGEGPSRVKLIAGIRKNGITDDRIQYPLYATWEQELNLVPEQTLFFTPEFKYYENLRYWLADFNTGLRFDTLDCTATMELVASDSTLVDQGLRNGRINLDLAHPLYRGVSSGDPFTNTGTVSFLEVDYRSDVPLLVGVSYYVAGNRQLFNYAYAVPTKKGDGSMPWNKVYFDMATPWNVSGAADKRFYIQASLEGATTGIMELDNIKLVQP